MTELLYSANARLAYQVAEQYFGRIHYVWCSPYFDDSTIPPMDWSNPRSSTPAAIARELYKDIATRDSHSAKIESIRAGLLLGAKAKESEGTITTSETEEIASIVAAAERADFSPVVYVIPLDDEVEGLISNPSPEQKAHPLSSEVLITHLPREKFDVIDVGKLLGP